MKLLVVDDHAIVREGLAILLRQLQPDTIVLQASNTAEGLTAAREHADLDLVLLDLLMPGADGILALREFARHRPDVPVIVLSSSEDPADVRLALERGALGYVPKSAGPQTLLLAVKLVLAGDIYVPPLMLEQTRQAAARPGSTATQAMIGRLTERQLDVLRLVSRDLSNREIGTTLGLSEKTVKAHLTAIFKVLAVSNREQASAVAKLARLT